MRNAEDEIDDELYDYCVVLQWACHRKPGNKPGDCSGVVQHVWSWDTKTTKTTTMVAVGIPWQMVKHPVLPFWPQPTLDPYQGKWEKEAYPPPTHMKKKPPKNHPIPLMNEKVLLAKKSCGKK